MKVAIHQPNYLPNASFFYKMAQVDAFVFYDDVQYEQGEWTNANYIRTAQGKQRLTVPVHLPNGRDTLIKDVEIDELQKWRHKHIKSLEFNYRKAKNFHKVMEDIYFYCVEDWSGNLASLNIALIEEMAKALKIKTQFYRSSEFELKSKGSDKILDICRILNADVYYTGMTWATKNLKREDFANNEIDIVWLPVKDHKPYKQQYEPYIGMLSELDYLMNEADLK